VLDNSPPAADSLEDLVRSAEACKTEAELTTFYAKTMGELAKVNDGTTARSFKKKALAHREKLRAGNTIDMQQGDTQ